ncbi:MAG: RluA family pseudouridine synthase [Burkholderiales bacterium]|nr:RluA family pseudouridine synthase [Burkholderiales bacterium]
MVVDLNSAGQRLDNFLMRHLKGVPKTHVYRIIRSGEVRVNKGRASADTRVQPGDVVRLPPVRVSERVAEKAQEMAQQAAHYVPAKAFPVLFEDEHFMAIDKPAGVAVHGGSGVSFGVIEQLRMAHPNLHYLELVHRLDRETSGVLLIAKKRSALKNLQDQFRERETGKTYLALVLGQWPSNKRVLDKSLHKYLLPNGERRVKVVAKDDPDAMPSLTLVKVNAFSAAPPQNGSALHAATGGGGVSLLEVTIKTGRTHQIRVHLASEGMPIAGDDKYGDFDVNKLLARADQPVPLKRMFLHAWRFQCKHPLTGKRMDLQAELPPELAQFMANALPGASVGAAAASA